MTMAAGSSVFKVMLGPKLKEGKGPAASQVLESYKLQLEEDNAGDTSVICCIIHHRNQ